MLADASNIIHKILHVTCRIDNRICVPALFCDPCTEPHKAWCVLNQVQTSSVCRVFLGPRDVFLRYRGTRYFSCGQEAVFMQLQSETIRLWSRFEKPTNIFPRPAFISTSLEPCIHIMLACMDQSIPECMLLLQIHASTYSYRIIMWHCMSSRSRYILVVRR